MGVCGCVIPSPDCHCNSAITPSKWFWHNQGTDYTNWKPTGESATMKTGVILIKLTHGGYVVKQHDPACGYTELLFAGSLGDCLGFIGIWMEHDEEKMEGE